MLIVYLVSIFLAGWAIVKKWFDGMPFLLTVVAAGLLGVGLGVPVTYAFSCMFSRTNDPLFWGVFVTSVLELFLFFRLKKNLHTSVMINLSSLLLVLFSVALSFWMMNKTFRAGPGGQVFVGGGTIFDASYFLGLMRSVSWGTNIPFASPYFTGAPLFYHFFFIFFTAIWEHFGVPVVYAINIPSALSFAALLCVVYYLPQIIVRTKPIVGWVAVIMTVTNSSLTFWQMKNLKDLWRLPSYPFAGPFDGSTISIFMTLNNYVNQRHLAFGIGLGLLLYLLTVNALTTKKMDRCRAVILGAVTGLLLLWHMAIYVLAGITTVSLFVSKKSLKGLGWYLISAAVVSLFCVLPNTPYLIQTAAFINAKFVSGMPWLVRPASWALAEYLWQNLGLLPVAAVWGYFQIPEKFRRFTAPFIVLFGIECGFAGIGHRGFDQKFLSFLVIGINILAAVGVTWLWERRRLVWKACALVVFFILTVSGIIDLMPIKNEFAYPLIDKQTAPAIEWIRSVTPKNSIFVSYSDMIDPVVMAGRTNYFGFYGNVGWYDRSTVVSKVYAGDVAEAKAHNISYVLVPKWKKSDFPYVVDVGMLRRTYSVAYEDDRVVIFGI